MTARPGPISPAIARLLARGPLPTEDDPRPDAAYLALLAEYGPLTRLARPVTDEEAPALLPLFNPVGADSCFGLAWTLPHFIETAPSWPGPPRRRRGAGRSRLR